MIIIFYPTLPIHVPDDSPSPNFTDRWDRIAERWRHFRKDEPIDQNKARNKRKKANCAQTSCTYDNKHYLRFRSVPNVIPTPDHLEKLLNDEDEDSDLKGWELEGKKQSLAWVYNVNFKIHLKKHFRARKHGKTFPHKNSQEDKFIHLFAFPLFSMVSAYWSRLIIRRSFDLDLLEWRSARQLSSRTIEEIKSRRIAITRHQQHISTSLSTLRRLVLAENGRSPAESESAPSWNICSANGLVPDDEDEDSWERIYGDYYELQSSVNALEARAAKIHDSIIGLLRVAMNERAEESSKSQTHLNLGGAVFAFLLLPFQMLGPFFKIQAFEVHWRRFALWVFWIALALVGGWFVIWFAWWIVEISWNKIELRWMKRTRRDRALEYTAAEKQAQLRVLKPNYRFFDRITRQKRSEPALAGQP